MFNNVYPLVWFFALVFVTYDIWGMLGATWASMFCGVCAMVGMANAEKDNGKWLDTMSGIAYDIECIKGIIQDINTKQQSADVWTDILRIMRHNPNITISYVENDKSAILWFWDQTHRLPSNDREIIDVYGAYLKSLNKTTA